MIDDPFGTMADARSETERKNVWDWYTGTVYNRLEKNGAIVLINHRMHAFRQSYADAQRNTVGR
jgi:hypothetical protein